MFDMKSAKEGLLLTEEQVRIRDEIKEGSDHVIVYALAGTGKTTQMVLSLDAMRTRLATGKLKAGVMAFNKSVARELKGKVPRSVYAGTSHGLAYRILRENWGDVDVDPEKTWDLIGELKGRHGVRTWRRGQRPAVKQLVSLLKQNGYDPRQPQKGVMEGLCEDHGIYWPGGELEVLYDFATDVMKEGLKRRDTVDFDDQIWLPYVERLRMEPFDLLMVDEAQDLNRVQQYIALENAKRLVVVGDKKQSVYGFRGADPESMDTFHNCLAEDGRVVHMPLTVCWRCSQRVIELAQKIVPEIQARYEAPEGSWSVGDPETSYREWANGDMVVCRTNAPLIAAVYRLIRDGRSAFVQGRDVAKGLVRLVERFEDEANDVTLRGFAQWLDYYERKEEQRIERENGSGVRLAAMKDRCDCLRVMAVERSRWSSSVEALKTDLKTLFKDNGDPRYGIRLSSIHRAKGLEADRVFVLEPGTMPHRMAAQPWEMEQEKNAAYIAVTRARNRLEFVGGTSRYFDD